ncbi:MAG: extracytoplasmic sigma factor ECF [Phycisphaerae bacterium]|nr:MAG: extracytoplasmic sigma factor ECF [Phycisphaerae bacterium]
MGTSSSEHESGLTDRLYRELRQLAAWYIAAEAPGHTLQPTALVHEAYVRIAPEGGAGGMDHASFMAVAARVMRNVLVDHARKHLAVKRGGGGTGERADGPGWRRVPMERAENGEAGCAGVDILTLHEALERLERLSPRQARVVEARFFAGLSVDETATALGVSSRTVEVDWRMARAWLARELNSTGETPAMEQKDGLT